MATIGLSSSEVVTKLTEALQNRWTQFEGLLQAVDAQEAPELSEMLSQVSATREQIAVIITFLGAVGDLIEANNAEIAKQVPHIDK